MKTGKNSTKNYRLLKSDEAVVVMLGRPRPNLQEQIVLLQEARDWLYKKRGMNVVQHQLTFNGEILGWSLSVNHKRPHRKGIRAWMQRIQDRSQQSRKFGFHQAVRS